MKHEFSGTESSWVKPRWYRLESESECTCSLIPRLYCGNETSEWKYIHTCKRKNSTHSMVL